MKAKQLKVKNIGCIEDSTIELNKPLILFYGDIKQGKTTYLNAVRWAFGGSFPSDIIRHGELEASIELTFDNGSISRSFYVNKEGEVVSRPQNIVLNNKVCGVKDLKAFLNPFLLNQNHLADMNEVERNRFIIDLFNIDTTEIDANILAKEKAASELRATIKAYGEINLIEVEKPLSIEEIESKKVEKQKEINAKKEEVKPWNDKLKADWESKKTAALQVISDFNSKQDQRQTVIDSSRNMLNQIFMQIKETIFEKCFDVDGAKKILETLPKPEAKKELKVEIPEPTYKEVCESELITIDNQIQEAKLQQVKYESYLKDKQRFDAKESDQQTLKATEAEIKNLRAQKLSKLSEINGKIEGVEANETGIVYENTAFNMLSTSQLMTLSSKLSALYPEGFGLELIDRGESLGKSIFEFVTKAENEQKTILATIVGERPASVPENIGVFVVESGGLKQ